MSGKPLRIAVLSCLLLAAGTAFAQALYSVEYVDGTVDYGSGKSWKGLALGDSVPSDASIRLGRGAILELIGSGKRISIVKEGVYSLSSLASSGSEPQKARFLQIFNRKIRSFLGGSGGEQSVFGVRAAQVEASGFESGGKEAREQGEVSLASGDYPAAAASFRYALDEAMPDEEGELRMLLASALALMDRPGAALGALRGGEADASPARSLFEASLLARAGAPDEALALIRAANFKSESAAIAAEAAEIEALALEAMAKRK